MYIYMYLENHVVSELAQKCMYMYMSVTVIGHYWDISKILYWYIQCTMPIIDTG